MTRTKKYGEPYIEKIDKNGSEHWVDNNCPKCGGSGYIHGYEFIDGARCWKCGATGSYPHRWIKRTPEYEAKLNAKREAKERANNLSRRSDFLKKNGFDDEGKIYVVAGDTYEIRNELKENGARYRHELGWYFSEKPESYSVIELRIEECFTENAVANLIWKQKYEIQEIINSKLPNDIAPSEYIGNIGERITVSLKLVKSFSYETNFSSSYFTSTSYIHSLIDEKDNVFIWKTTTELDESKTYNITGTIKDHSEYNGVKQTVITRCKIKNNEQA